MFKSTKKHIFYLSQIQNLIGGDIDRLMFEPTGDDFDGIPDEKVCLYFVMKILVNYNCTY